MADDLGTDFGLPKTPGIVESVGDYLKGFTWSALEAFPEMVGITPSSETLDWRAANPVSGFVSEVPGFVLPYAGWFKAVKGVKMLQGIESAAVGFGRAAVGASEMPALSAGLAEVARFAPFEIGRVALSQAVGDKPFGEMAGEAAINLALAGGIAGGIQKWLGAGVRAPNLGELFPAMDFAAPKQMQLRQLNEALKNGVYSGPHAEDLARQLSVDIRSEVRPGRHVAAIADDLDSPTFWTNADDKVAAYKATQAVAGRDATTIREGFEALFKISSPQNPAQKKLLIRDERVGYSSSDAIEEIATKAKLPNNWVELAQFPRVIEFSMEKDLANAAKAGAGAKVEPVVATRTAERMHNFVTTVMKNSVEGWRYAKEADGGLFILAKKIEGTKGKVAPTDKWLILKTDQPDKFVPRAGKWGEAMAAAERFTLQLPKDVGPLWNFLSKMREAYPYKTYSTLHEARKEGQNALAKIIPKSKSELFNRMGELVQSYMAPANAQFSKNIRASYLFKNMKMLRDEAEGLVQRIMQGRVKDTKQGLLMMGMGFGRQIPQGVKAMVDSLSDKALAELTTLFRAPKPIAQVMAGPYLAETKQAANTLFKIHQETMKEYNALRKLSGENPVKMLDGDLGIMRRWDGDYFYVLRNERGHIAGIAAGFNKRTALANAKGLSVNTNLRIAEDFARGQLDKIPADVRKFVPGIHESGIGHVGKLAVGGYKFSTTNFTKAELVEEINKSLLARVRGTVDRIVNVQLSNDMHALGKENLHYYDMLEKRRLAMIGQETNFGRLQNEMADKVLAPVLGGNSATKIVNATKEGMHYLQLGGLKLGYIISNVMSLLQTTLPEVMWIGSAAPARVQLKYMFVPTAGGQPMGLLEPFSVMRGAMKQLGKPDDLFRERFVKAIEDRVIDPRMLEEFIGQDSKTVVGIKEAMKEGGFLNVTKAVMNFGGATSERLSRAMAFSVGDYVGANHLGLDGETLYRFAKDFTERVMYSYTTMDRPSMFTTPLGSMFGQFKTWMINYMSSMMEYAGEGMLYNNFKPLLWQTASTLAVGGAAATPLYFLADGFAKGMSGKNGMQLLYDELPSWMADGVMYGLPAAITGVSLSSQMSTPAADPMRDANMLFSFAIMDRAKYVGAAASAAWGHYAATGEHPGRDPDTIRDLVRAFAPVNIYRAATQLSGDGIDAVKTGYPLIKEVGPVYSILYAMGLNPVQLDRAMAVSEELYTDKNKMAATVRNYGDAYAEAVKANRGEVANALIRKAAIEGVNISSVIRSATIRMRNESESAAERLSTPLTLEKWRNALGG